MDSHCYSSNNNISPNMMITARAVAFVMASSHWKLSIVLLWLINKSSKLLSVKI